MLNALLWKAWAENGKVLVSQTMLQSIVNKRKNGLYAFKEKRHELRWTTDGNTAR